MAFRSTNPVNGLTVKEFPAWSPSELDNTLQEVAQATPGWAAQTIAARCELMTRAAEVLRARRDELAELITLEMGKLSKEATAEIDKCAWVCDYYADNGPAFLADEVIETDARRSLVA